MKRLVIVCLFAVVIVLALSSCNEHRYRQGHVRGPNSSPMNPGTESRYYPQR